MITFFAGYVISLETKSLFDTNLEHLPHCHQHECLLVGLGCKIIINLGDNSFHETNEISEVMQFYNLRGLYTFSNKNGIWEEHKSSRLGNFSMICAGERVD